MESLSEENTVAFKEWALVCDAIAEGNQSVILRKGGIAEGKSGFQWKNRRFFLFPTQFHAQKDQVKSLSPSLHEEMEGKIAFSLYVEAIKVGRLSDWGEIVKLAPFHIWKEEVIRERFEWGDEPGISYAVIQARKLKEPLILEDRKSFGGCRSWIDLPEDEMGGVLERVKGAERIEATCRFPKSLE